MKKIQTQKNSGITLIALVITIIVLLILAGVTIATLTGDNGILTKASKASEQTKIGEEKEAIGIAYNGCLTTSENNSVASWELEDELIKNGYDATVTGVSNLKIHFTETDKYYTINDGVISEYVKPELTDVYVALYNDGTLVFSNNMDDFEEDKVEKYYDGNYKETLFDWTTPWSKDGATYEKIKSVEFINKIVPKYTAFWFGECSILTDIKGLNNLDTSNVESMAGMFENCNALQTLDVSSFDTSNVKNMSFMFDWCNSLSSLNCNFDTRNVEDMSYMFDWCENLTNLNLSNFGTGKPKNIEGMFLSCQKLEKLDISNFRIECISNAVDIFDRVPTSLKIKTNSAMKEWLNTNYPTYTNIEV